MKIFEVGLGRTGSRSVTMAAEILGFKAKHGFKKSPEYEIDATYKALRGKYDFDIIRDHDFLSNLGTPIYRQLDRAYPDAKFILTVRDFNDWFLSCRRNTVDREDVFDEFDQGEVSYRAFDRLLTFGSLVITDDLAKEAYMRHTMEVKEHFRSYMFDDKFITMNVCGGDGWETLCPFLEKDIPDVEFPHLKSKSKVDKLSGK